MERFRKAYNFNLPDIVGKARYHTEKNSLKKARLPKSLPLEDDMRKLKQFLIQEIDDTVGNFSLNQYTWLRSLVVARLTLYNARRGEEGSRLLLEEWYDALNSTWIPQEAVESVKDDAEKYLIGQFKLAYMAGKGRKCVPVLIPNDLVGPIELLISHRQNFGIAETNNFLFATKSSSSHCSGWHAVFTVCEAVGISSVTATKNRHRVSTVYASLDMSENDRKIFYDHLGHNETINKDNYQCPPGVTEVLHMGKFLSSLEGKNILYTKVIFFGILLLSSIAMFGLLISVNVNGIAFLFQMAYQQRQQKAMRRRQRQKVKIARILIFYMLSYLLILNLVNKI